MRIVIATDFSKLLFRQVVYMKIGFTSEGAGQVLKSPLAVLGDVIFAIRFARTAKGGELIGNNVTSYWSNTGDSCSDNGLDR
jgi:hypothetical protein